MRVIHYLLPHRSIIIIVTGHRMYISTCNIFSVDKKKQNKTTQMQTKLVFPNENHKLIHIHNIHRNDLLAGDSVTKLILPLRYLSLHGNYRKPIYFRTQVGLGQ